MNRWAQLAESNPEAHRRASKKGGIAAARKRAAQKAERERRAAEEAERKAEEQSALEEFYREQNLRDMARVAYERRDHLIDDL